MTTRFLPFFLASTLVACGGGSAPDGDTAAPIGGDTANTGTPTDLATAYADRGVFAVGYTLLNTSVDGATLPVKAWYPTASTDDESITYDVALKLAGFGGAEVPFLGTAVRDGAPDASLGARPLVVLSHGYSLNAEWYLTLAEHLASHGFVVMAPEHTETDWATDIVQTTTRRPRDVSATIDLAESGVLDGTIDASSVAVLGHSYGGYTALAAAGARFDLADLEARCEDVTDGFTASYFCDPFLDGRAELAAELGLSEVPEGLWPAVGDPRVDAIVPMAGDAYLFGTDGLAEVTVPVLLLGGTADTGTPWAWGAGLAWDHVGSADRMLLGFDGGEHMLPTTSCANMPWIEALPAEYQGYFCGDPAWDKAEAHALIHQVTTAFLLHALAGDADASAALAPEVYADVAGLQVLRVE